MKQYLPMSFSKRSRFFVLVSLPIALLCGASNLLAQQSTSNVAVAAAISVRSTNNTTWPGANLTLNLSVSQQVEWHSGSSQLRFKGGGSQPNVGSGPSDTRFAAYNSDAPLYTASAINVWARNTSATLSVPAETVITKMVSPFNTIIVQWTFTVPTGTTWTQTTTSAPISLNASQLNWFVPNGTDKIWYRVKPGQTGGILAEGNYQGTVIATIAP